MKPDQLMLSAPKSLISSLIQAQEDILGWLLKNQGLLLLIDIKTVVKKILPQAAGFRKTEMVSWSITSLLKRLSEV